MYKEFPYNNHRDMLIGRLVCLVRKKIAIMQIRGNDFWNLVNLQKMIMKSNGNERGKNEKKREKEKEMKERDDNLP